MEWCIPQPHSNSRKCLSYVRTMPSTLNKLRKVAVNLTPSLQFVKWLVINDCIKYRFNAGFAPRWRWNCSERKKKDPLFSGKRARGRAMQMDCDLCTWILTDLVPHHHDPTFSLGNFDVTVTTYQHPMLLNSKRKHPVMMGPIMIHKQKMFEMYHFLFLNWLAGSPHFVLWTVTL